MRLKVFLSSPADTFWIPFTFAYASHFASGLASGSAKSPPIQASVDTCNSVSCQKATIKHYKYIGKAGRWNHVTWLLIWRMFWNSVYHWRVCTRNFKILNHNLPFPWAHTLPYMPFEAVWEPTVFVAFCKLSCSPQLLFTRRLLNSLQPGPSNSLKPIQLRHVESDKSTDSISKKFQKMWSLSLKQAYWTGWYNMFDITQVLTYPNAKVDTSHPDLPSHISETTRNPRTEDPHEHCNLASNGSSEQGFLFQEEAGVPELVDLSSIMCIYIYTYLYTIYTYKKYAALRLLCLLQKVPCHSRQFEGMKHNSSGMEVVGDSCTLKWERR